MRFAIPKLSQFFRRSKSDTALARRLEPLAHRMRDHDPSSRPRPHSAASFFPASGLISEHVGGGSAADSRSSLSSEILARVPTAPVEVELPGRPLSAVTVSSAQSACTQISAASHTVVVEVLARRIQELEESLRTREPGEGVLAAGEMELQGETVRLREAVDGEDALVSRVAGLRTAIKGTCPRCGCADTDSEAGMSMNTGSMRALTDTDTDLSATYRVQEHAQAQAQEHAPSRDDTAPAGLLRAPRNRSQNERRPSSSPRTLSLSLSSPTADASQPAAKPTDILYNLLAPLADRSVLHDACARVLAGDDHEDALVDAIKAAAAVPGSTWRRLLEPVVGPRAPKAYIAQVECTLGARRETRGWRLRAAFWKGSARRDGGCAEVVTPSVSQISDVVRAMAEGVVGKGFVQGDAAGVQGDAASVGEEGVDAVGNSIGHRGGNILSSESAKVEDRDAEGIENVLSGFSRATHPDASTPRRSLSQITDMNISVPIPAEPHPPSHTGDMVSVYAYANLPPLASVTFRESHSIRSLSSRREVPVGMTSSASTSTQDSNTARRISRAHRARVSTGVGKTFGVVTAWDGLAGGAASGSALTVSAPLAPGSVSGSVLSGSSAPGSGSHPGSNTGTGTGSGSGSGGSLAGSTTASVLKPPKSMSPLPHSGSNLGSVSFSASSSLSSASGSTPAPATSNSSGSASTSGSWDRLSSFLAQSFSPFVHILPEGLSIKYPQSSSAPRNSSAGNGSGSALGTDAEAEGPAAAVRQPAKANANTNASISDSEGDGQGSSSSNISSPMSSPAKKGKSRLPVPVTPTATFPPKAGPRKALTAVNAKSRPSLIKRFSWAISRPVLIDSTNAAAIDDAPMSQVRARVGPVKQGVDARWKMGVSKEGQIGKRKRREKEKEKGKTMWKRAPLGSVDENRAQSQAMPKQKMRRKVVG